MYTPTHACRQVSVDAVERCTNVSVWGICVGTRWWTPVVRFQCLQYFVEGKKREKRKIEVPFLQSFGTESSLLLHCRVPPYAKRERKKQKRCKVLSVCFALSYTASLLCSCQCIEIEVAVTLQRCNCISVCNWLMAPHWWGHVRTDEDTRRKPRRNKQICVIM